MERKYNVIAGSNNKEFETTYAKFLSENEPQLNLFLRNLDGSERTLPKNNVRGAVLDGKEMQLLFLNAYPFAMQLAGADGAINAVRSLVEYCAERDVEISGVQGELELCSAFASEYERVYHKKMRMRLGMSILCLTRLKAGMEIRSAAMGELRHARTDDAFAVTWVQDMLWEGAGEKIDKDSAQKKLDAMIKEKNLFVYQNAQGAPVAFVRVKPIGRGVTLNYVYTHKPYRNQGYGRAMVSEACKMPIDAGKYVVLFVDKNNIAANKLYASVGFQKLCDNYAFRTEE